MEDMIYAHHLPLTSQGNIYSICKIPVKDGYFKILVASLRREVLCFEYNDSSSTILSACSKEILFTYIPNGAEIISIDAFNKSNNENDIVIGITIIKTDSTKETYLNIYSVENSKEFNIDNISQNCSMIDLNYVPYQLYHTIVPNFDTNSEEFVWLLSGSDSKIHLYKAVNETNNYKEVKIENSFAELTNLLSIVTWMDICYYNSNKCRITVYGCESGYVKISTVNVLNNLIIKHWEIQFVNMIASVKLFSRYFNKDMSTDLEPEIDLLITNTTLPSVVFNNILKNELNQRHILLKSNFFNIQSSSCIADIDFDGENEILIGTYGQELLHYKYNYKSGWKMTEQRSFGNPIHSVQFFDITGDGMKELIVLTMKGVHILQNKTEKIEQILLDRLQRMLIED